MGRGFVLAVALAVLPVAAQATTGGELLAQCAVLERGASVRGGSVRLPESREAAQCWFYMAAVQDFAATTADEGGPSLIGACPSPETTRLDLIRALTRYGRAHREEAATRASVLVVRALAEAFPCKTP